MFFIFKDGADFVKTDGTSKGSSIGSKIGEDDILWANSDFGVWLFDRYLADLMKSKEKSFENFEKQIIVKSEIELVRPSDHGSVGSVTITMVKWKDQ